MIRQSLLIGAFSICLLGNEIKSDLFFDTNSCSKVIEKANYKSCFSFKYKGTRVLSYKIDDTLSNNYSIDERPKFYMETQLPKEYRVSPKDYTGTGYDRGHLVPASFDFSYESLLETYSMINIVPQTPSLNRKIWIKAEKYERLVATKLKSLEVLNFVEYSDEKLNRDSISIPSKFYKVIFNNEKNFYKCFSFENKNYLDDDRLKEHEISCEPFFTSRG